MKDKWLNLTKYQSLLGTRRKKEIQKDTNASASKYYCTTSVLATKWRGKRVCFYSKFPNHLLTLAGATFWIPKSYDSTLNTEEFRLRKWLSKAWNTMRNSSSSRSVRTLFSIESKCDKINWKNINFNYRSKIMWIPKKAKLCNWICVPAFDTS